MTAISVAGTANAPLAASPPILTSAAVAPGSRAEAALGSVSALHPLRSSPAQRQARPPEKQQFTNPNSQDEFEAVYQAVPLLRPRQVGQHPAVRFEVVAPTTEADDLGRLAQRYVTNEPTIDALLDRDATPEQRRDIQRDLGILPPSLLSAAREAGVRIWIANRDDVEAPARLFTPDGPNPEAGSVRSTETVVTGRPTGRARHTEARAGDVTQFLVQVTRDPQAGDTLESLARLHGAETPEQIGEYVRIAGPMNATDSTPLDPRRPLAEGENIKIPDLGYYQGQRYSSSTFDRIKLLNSTLRDPRIGGQYQHFARLLTVKANTLPDPAPKFLGGERTILHEFGHVVDSLMFDDVDTYKQHAD